MRPAGAALPADGFSYALKKNNSEVIQSGDLALASGRATIETTLNEPAMIYVEVSPRGGKPCAVAGAAVAPTQLQPSVPRPADFDAFWEAKIKALEAVSANAVLTPGEGGRPGVEYATIRMDNVGGAHVYGQLAKPARDGKFPALLLLQWASPPYPLQKRWVTDRAAEGWLVLNVEPHDVPGDMPPAFYAALPAMIKNYAMIGNTDRDRSYFLQMYLGDYRAVDYLASRPDWDGKTIVLMGGSMGGQQSLVLAGMRPETIAAALVCVPAGADTNGDLHGRKAGYPNWPSNNPDVMKTALYFDTVNFASRIKAAVMAGMGFIDTTSPPAGVWTALNQISVPKEPLPMIESDHDNITPQKGSACPARQREILDLLVKGGEFKPDGIRP